MNIGRMNGESEAYRQARDALLEAEIALRDQREAVAAQRRKLPRDTAIDDYTVSVPFIYSMGTGQQLDKTTNK